MSDTLSIKKILFFIFLVFFTVPNHLLQAQCDQSTEGTDFWLGFMHHREAFSNPVLSVIITSKDATTGSVFINSGATLQQNFTLAANSSITVTIPITQEMLTSEVIENKGIRVTSVEPVTVYILNFKQFSADAALVFPINTLDTEYYTMTYAPEGPAAYRSEFLIIATEDNTTVTITPSVATLGGNAAGVPFSVTLDEGQTYQVQSAGSNNAIDDITGSKIVSDKPIALFSGNFRTRVPNNQCCYDHLVEQIPPQSAWGRSYITTPLATRAYDIFRILASEDNTNVTINGVPIPVLDAGEFYEFDTDGSNVPQVIASDKRIMVAQFALGRDTDGLLNADPSMIILAPNVQMQDNITYEAFAGTTVANYMTNILTRTDNTDNILLDGAPVAGWAAIPGSNYSFVQVTGMTPGTHTLDNSGSDRGFLAYVYGFGNAESFGYLAGMNLNTALDLGDEPLFCFGGVDNYELDAGPDFDSYEWRLLPDPTVIATTRTYNATESGFYSIAATDPAGCTQIDTIEVAFSSLPIAEIQYEATTLLENQEIFFCDSEGPQTFTANTDPNDPEVTYEWRRLDTDAIVSTAPTMIADDFSNTLSYQLIAYNAIATCADDFAANDTTTVIVTFVPEPTADIRYNGNTIIPAEGLIICAEEGTRVLNALNNANADYEANITYQWRDLTNGIDLGTNPTQNTRPENIPEAGTMPITIEYEVEMTNTLSNCITTDIVEITYNPTPKNDQNVIGVGGLFCGSGDIEIIVENADANITYQLLRNGALEATQTPDTDGDLIFSEINITAPTGTFGTTDYTFTVRAIDETRDTNCEIMLLDNTILSVFPNPSFNITGSKTICEGESTTINFNMTGNPPYQIQFETTIEGVTTLTDTLVTVNNFTRTVTRGTYKSLSITDDNDCFNNDGGSQAVITVLTPPEMELEANKIEICTDETLILTANGADRYIFFFNGIPIQEEASNTLEMDRLAPGTYEVYSEGYFAAAPTCRGISETITITVNPIPQAYIGVPTRFVCEDVPVVFEAVVTNGLDGDNFIYDWQRLNEDGTSSPVGVGEPTLSVLDTGRYFVIITDAGSPTLCQSVSNTVTVRPFGDIPLSLGEDVQPVCDPDGLPYRLVASDIIHGSNIVYEWYKTGEPDIIGTDSIYDVTEPGFYSVIIRDESSTCAVSDTVRIDFNSNPDFEIAGYDPDNCLEEQELFIQATNLTGMIINWFGPGIVAVENDGLNATVNRNGVYTVTVNDTAANCITTKTIEISVYPPIALNLDLNVDDEVVLCQDAIFTVDAFLPSHDADYEYEWIALNGGNSVSNTSVLNVDFELQGETYELRRYEIRISDPTSPGCESKDTIAVRFERKAEVEIAEFNPTLCLGESLQLVAETQATDVSWSDGTTGRTLTIEPTEPGLYTYIVTAGFDNSCQPVYDTATVRVTNKPDLDLPEEVVLCETETIRLDAFDFRHEPRYIYEWTNLETGEVISNESEIVWAFDSLPQPNYENTRISVAVIDTLGGGDCRTEATVNVRFERLPVLEVSASDSIVCIDETVTITATGAEGYLWSNGEEGASITVTLDSAGWHRFDVIGFNPNACDSVSSRIWIFAKPLPIVKAHTDTLVEICLGESVTLTPSGADTYEWTHAPQENGDITVSPTATTDYIVIGRDSLGCENRDTVRVVVFPTPQIEAESLQFCEGETVKIGLNTSMLDSATLATAEFRWKTGERGDSIEVFRTDTYWVNIKVGDCEYRDSIHVAFKAHPVLALANDTTICFEDANFNSSLRHEIEVEVTNKDPEATYDYQWVRREENRVVGSNPVLSVSDSGTYVVTVTANYPNACSTTDSMLVSVVCEPRIFIPQAFSPNNDGLNDVFQIFGRHVYNIDMRVFNRWGEPIFHSFSADLENMTYWDGTHKGKQVPTGSYMWQIRYNSKDRPDETIRSNGVVVIYR
ncbi:MAG: gliding motility-associated C-terminal domain-containing protein [Bernardetiaceae bacterium]|nr:gliding motility-associated C-terminal domain-containing protein [Bernardetiaceae bacterium]